MRCPIRSDHTMVEVAPRVYQCGVCGYGPSQQGYRPFWSLADPVFANGTYTAFLVTYVPDLECYHMSQATWDVDEEGRRLVNSLHEDPYGYLSTAEELAGAPLPVVIRAKGKWAYPPNKPKLQPQMFASSLGLKELTLAEASK
jgi:hypothetical protein